MQPSLPITPYLTDIVATLRKERRLVLQAAPGAGKTTAVPRALLEESPRSDGGAIWVLQPRRIAARLAARYVATSLGEEIGERVGYQVRHEQVTSASTRLFFVTEGVLLRRLLGDATLAGIDTLVFDEFHERSLDGDLALALALRLTRSVRPDLRLLVMSATLDAAPIAHYLDQAPHLQIEGRSYPVETEYVVERQDPHRRNRPLELRVAGAVQHALHALEPASGDVLVFLPGKGEIERAMAACASLRSSHDLVLLPLHGGLSLAEQARAVGPCAQRKVIFATNVAETSITIDGVRAVIDSGLARTAGHDAWSGVSTLELGPISQAAAEQRRGRAGRTAAGHCWRLYGEHDLRGRAAFDTPEIHRADLAGLVLQLWALGLETHEVPWLDPPPAPAVAAGVELLTRLGVAHEPAQLNDVGRAMLRFPVHPRQARLLVAAKRSGIAEVGAAAAALLELGPAQVPQPPHVHSGPCDIAAQIEHWREAKHQRQGWAMQMQRSYEQLCRLAVGSGRNHDAHDDDELALRRTLLAAYPDRVACTRQGGGRRQGQRELLLAGGGRLTQAETSSVRDGEWVVVCSARQVGEAQGRRRVAEWVSAIEPDWLVALPGNPVREVRELTWNDALGRVDAVEQLLYDGLVLNESRGAAPSSPEASLILRRALGGGGRDLLQAEPVQRLRARLATLSTWDSQVAQALTTLAQDESLVMAACNGCTRLSEVQPDALVSTLLNALPAGVAGRLDLLTPASITLPSGRKLTVHYETDRPPWAESYLQDFFGMRATPTVAGGKLPVTLHLLAPNRRAVQVTQDLASFWRVHYPSLRPSLSRRYPRHVWPDDPLAASPPPPHSHRRR